MSNSSLSVSIVFCVSCLNCPEFSICVFSNFRSFLLSSSSCLHFNAFLRMFSLFWPELLLSYWLKSPKIIDLKFFMSSTYCIRASMFFCIMAWDFSLQINKSSIFLRLKPNQVTNLNYLLLSLSLTHISLPAYCINSWSELIGTRANIWYSSPLLMPSCFSTVF